MVGTFPPSCAKRPPVDDAGYVVWGIEFETLDRRSHHSGRLYLAVDQRSVNGVTANTLSTD